MNYNNPSDRPEKVPPQFASVDDASGEAQSIGRSHIREHGEQPQEQGNTLAKAAAAANNQPHTLQGQMNLGPLAHESVLANYGPKKLDELRSSDTAISLPVSHTQDQISIHSARREAAPSPRNHDTLKEQDEWAVGLPLPSTPQPNDSNTVKETDISKPLCGSRGDVAPITLDVVEGQRPQGGGKVLTGSRVLEKNSVEDSQQSNRNASNVASRGDTNDRTSANTGSSFVDSPNKQQDHEIDRTTGVATSPNPRTLKSAQAFGATMTSSPSQWDTWTPEMLADPFGTESEAAEETKEAPLERPASRSTHLSEMQNSSGVPGISPQIMFEYSAPGMRHSQPEKPDLPKQSLETPGFQAQQSKGGDHLSAINTSLPSPSAMESTPSSSRDPSIFSQTSSIWSSDTTSTNTSSTSALPAGSVRRKPIGSYTGQRPSKGLQQSVIQEDKIVTQPSGEASTNPHDRVNDKIIAYSPNVTNEKESFNSSNDCYGLMPQQRNNSGMHLSSHPMKSLSAPIVPTTSSTYFSINKIDSEGFPLLVRAASDGNGELVERTLADGAPKDAYHIQTKRTAIVEASEKGHVKIVELLLDYGCSVQYLDYGGMSALHYAAQKGYLLVAKALLDRGADVNIQGANGLTPLYLASWAPHANMVMLLLQRHANVNARDAWQRTALHVAASRGYVSICSILIDHRAQLESRDGSFKTPMLLSVAAQHVETVDLLLARSNLRPTDVSFLAAIFAAIEIGHIGMVESFLKKGATLKGLKHENYKPIISASKSGNPDMVDLMIKNNAKIKEKDSNGWNALHHAAHHGHAVIVERLAEKELAVSAVTSEKETPLHLAVKASNFAAVDALLRGNGSAYINAKDSLGQQPLHHAVRIGNIDIVNLLISNKSTGSAENAFGWKPLHLAVAYGHPPIVAQLITLGANIEDRLGSSSLNKAQTHTFVERGYSAEARWPFPGSKPLHLAIEYGHDEIARYLISRGAKIDSVCGEGWRPLHLAAFNSSPAMVEHLLSLGAYPHAVTDTLRQRTAFDIAKYRAQSPFLPNIGKVAPSEADKYHVQQLLLKAMSFTPKKPQELWMKQMKVLAGKGPEDKSEFLKVATVAGDVAGLKNQMARQTLAR